MPKTKNLAENVEDVEKKAVRKNKTSASKKATSKNTTAKKTTKKATVKKEEPKKEKTKKLAEKKEESKKTVVKKAVAKKEEVKKEEKKASKTRSRKTEKIENLKEMEKKVKEKVDESTIIEKIKNFLSKIIAIQEENSAEEEKQKGKKTASTKSKKEKSITPEYMLEYYDLPYRYNETVVKILAQTPKRLFVYWDISDNDREKYIKSFGDDFFYKTYPVLLLYNEDKKYVKEIPINDFANSWYIDIEDPKNKYIIQLGRKFKDTPEIINMSAFEKEKIILKTDYLPFADSNTLEVPNDHVLLESLPRFITFRNVKTNQEIIKDLRTFRDVFGKIYSVEEFYKEEYKDELSEEGMFDMMNPSSKLSSSQFK